MNIIEQAARRLEELRRSGIEPSGRGASTAGSPPLGNAQSLAARAARRLDEVPHTAPRGKQEPAQRAAVRSVATLRPDGPSQSKRVEIDLTRLAAMGYLTPETPRANIANEFRVIKRPLLNNVRGKSSAPVERANLIMVSSSVPGEGKTFVAVNLAMSIAMEVDKRVLLVDADVSRPSVLSRLGLEAIGGMLDVLADESVALSDVLLRTNIDTLSIMPAGAPRGRATELLASAAMGHLLEDMAARYSDRIIIFDAPPLLSSTESRVLATLMGQVVVVVEAQHTPQKSVAQALATLESCPVVMPLLNKAPQSEVGFYYGYYGPTGG